MHPVRRFVSSTVFLIGDATYGGGAVGAWAFIAAAHEARRTPTTRCLMGSLDS